MNRLILTTAMILAIAGCSPTPTNAPVVVQPDRSAVCTAIGPSFPLPEVGYSESQDTPVTVALAKKKNRQYREANARYKAACK